MEHIPTDGGALLVANHAGAIPSDAPAIMHGIETELGRPVYGLAEHVFRTLPVVGTLVGAGRRRHRQPPQRLPAAARAAAARPRLPRGHQGHLEALHRALPAAAVRARRLRRDRHAGRASRSSRSPSSAPRSRCRSCSTSRRLAKPLGVPYVPVTANMLAPRARSGLVAYFPAKFKIRVLEPIHFDVAARPAALQPQQGDGPRPRTSGERIQAALYDMLRTAAVGLVRLMRPSDGAFSSPGWDVLGWPGRPARSKPTPSVDVIVGLDRDEPTVELERTEYVRSDESYSILTRIVKADEGRHDRPHVPGRRLDRRSLAARSTRSTSSAR